MGPNGGGKSTLFKAMADLIPLSHGSLEIKGLSPKKAKQFIGYVPQNNQINWNFPLSVKPVSYTHLTLPTNREV